MYLKYNNWVSIHDLPINKESSYNVSTSLQRNSCLPFAENDQRRLFIRSGLYFNEHLWSGILVCHYQIYRNWDVP